MKRIASMLLAAVLLGGLSVSGGVLAGDRYGGGHGHVHGSVGIYLGAPLYGGWGYGARYGAFPGYYPGYYSGYYPAPYGYYPPAVIAVPTAPPVYVEQGASAPPAPASNYWYYCGSLRGYYPYVKECPEAWQRVAPQPSPPPG